MDRSALEAFLHIAREVLTHLNLAVVGVWLLDGRRPLRLEASVGFTPCLASPLAAHPPSNSPVARVVQAREALLLQDLSLEPDDALRAWAHEEGLLGFAGCPLIRSGQVRGVLAGFDYRPDRGRRAGAPPDDGRPRGRAGRGP